MTFEIGFLFALLAVMVYLFLTEKLPVDLTAFSGLVVLILFGYLTPEEAFQGFASPAVITMLSIFIVGASMLQTGVADIVGRRIHTLVGGREVPLMVKIMLVTATLSAFMNNIAATAVLMPAVASLARRAGIAPSRLFMPLAYGAILGGTTTLVGTPPNIIAAAMLEERGLAAFGLFDFSPVGIVLLGLGVVYMITVGKRLLPDRPVGKPTSADRDLAEVYQLHERLFSIRIPKGSALDGLSLREARLGDLGLQVLVVNRGTERYLAPDASMKLRGGDLLLVEGRYDDMEELLRVRGLDVEKAQPSQLPRPIRGVSGVRATVARESPLVGRTFKEIGFRERYGGVVVGIVRGNQILRERLGSHPLQAEDEILALGERSALARWRKEPVFEHCEMGLSALQQLQSYLYLLRIPEGSPLAGASIRNTRIGELVGLTVGGIIRDGEMRLAPSPADILHAGDRLLIAGDPDRVMALLKLGEVDFEVQVAEPTLQTDDYGIVEATVAPRSSAAGKTLRELAFRERRRLQVLALWRQGRLVRTKLADLVLRFGDAILIHGRYRDIREFAKDPDFVVLTDPTLVRRRTSKAPLALLGLGVLITFVVTGFQPIQVAAFSAATLVVLSGAIRMEEAYRAIEWRAIFLVAAVLPVGVAMERTGAALMMAESVTSIAGPLGPYAVLGAMVVLSSLLSQGLDGAPAVVLLTPVVTETASQLGVSPYPLMMGVSLAASAAFMTPFSHKANLLVMGAGGYRASDYLKVGTPLTIVLVIIMVFIVPIFFPF